MGRLASCIFILFLSVKGFTQKVVVDAAIENKVAGENSDTIYYDFKRPLTWDDFKGVPDYNNPGGAITSSGFAFNAQMNMENDVIHLSVRVYTFFSKKRSWKKPGINSDYHLLHEQRHFDITRLYAQKFCNELAKADFTAANYNKLLTSLFNTSFTESNDLQQRYDDETQHSIKTAEQLKWNDKIGQELSRMLVADR